MIGTSTCFENPTFASSGVSVTISLKWVPAGRLVPPNRTKPIARPPGGMTAGWMPSSSPGASTRPFPSSAVPEMWMPPTGRFELLRTTTGRIVPGP